MKTESMFKVRREDLHNFTREENEVLTRVGPATPMGNLMRQYWIPVVPTAHLKEPGGRPLRVRLLGEDLVLFRTSAGAVGLIGAFCPHRLAPLYFGRVEADGLRCAYHAWKYAPNGKCIEMPNIPADQQFKDEVQHPGYPCVERGGIIWTYMGLAKNLPELPDFEFLRVPDEHRIYRLFFQEANYLQVLEGGIDPTHVMWLHSPYDLSDEEMNAQQPAQQREANKFGVKKTPEDVEIFDRPAGFTYGAKAHARRRQKSLARQPVYSAFLHHAARRRSESGARLRAGRRRELRQVAGALVSHAQRSRKIPKSRSASRLPKKLTIRRRTRFPSVISA